ncbi:MAG: flagellin [Selenomonadaceae bacterium]|nr:flagellin [Selenomonadaceae bacterium]
MAGIGGVSSSLNTLNRVNSQYSSTLNKIATGSNVPSAKYSPSTYAISQRMSVNISSIHQSHQNTQNSNSMMKTAEGAVSNTVDILKSIKQSLINAANDTNTGSDRETIQQTIEQSLAQINENAGVQYNGMTLLDGTRSTSVNAGVGGDTNLHFGDMTSTGLGLTDSEGNSLISATSNIEDSIARVDSAIETASAQQSNIQSSLEASLDEITSLGAQQARLDFQAENYMTMEENEANSLSTLSDADLAKEITNLRSQDTQQQLALYTLRMENQNRSNILSLLQ